MSGRGLPEYRRDLEARAALSQVVNRIECLVVFGTVAQIDYDAAYARVSFTDSKGRGFMSDWMRWLEDTNGDDQEWSPPSINEVVEVICPGGNLNHGIIGNSVSTTDLPPISNSPTIRRKTWGKHPEASFFDYPFWEIEKAADRTHEWNYQPSKGAFRHEIGDKVLIHWTEDALIHRIGNTQYVMKDGSFTVTTADDLTSPKESVEIRLTLADGVEIHANHEANIRVQRSNASIQQPASVEAQVGGKAAITIHESAIKAGVNDNSSLVLDNASAFLEAKGQKAKLMLSQGVASLSLDGVSLAAKMQMATMGMAGSEITVTPPNINLGTTTLLTPYTVQQPAIAGVGTLYEAGPATATPRPSVKLTPQAAPARWPMEGSKGPYYPRTGKPKS